MRKLPAVCSFIGIAALAACGSDNDAKPDTLIVVPDAPIDSPPPIDAPPDARVFDFSCMGNPAPTTADANITLSGAASGLVLQNMQPSFVALTEATVDACQGNCQGQNKLDTQTTAASGCGQQGCDFTTAALATGGTPLDGYIKVSKTTFRTTNVFPAEALTTNTANIPALAFSASLFQILVGTLGAQQAANNGNLFVVITDCAATPIPGVQLVAMQGGQAVGNVVDVSSLSAQFEGTYAVFDVPPGDVELTASINGMTLRPRTIQAFSGESSFTQLTPGFPTP